jgi:hypothetical protein
MRKRGLTEYVIALVALLVWLAFEAGGKYLGWQTYPVGYWQKLSFGVLGMSVIAGVTWVWLGATFPVLKKLIDPDTLDFKLLTEWQKVKLAALFFCFYGFGAVLLASLY